jgi:hypothetical protein
MRSCRDACIRRDNAVAWRLVSRCCVVGCGCLWTPLGTGDGMTNFAPPGGLQSRAAFLGRRGRFRAAPRGLGKTRREPFAAWAGCDPPFSGVQNAEGEAAGPRNAARSWTLLQSSSLPLRASSLDGSQKPSAPCRFILRIFGNDLSRSGSVVARKVGAHCELLKPAKTGAA